MDRALDREPTRIRVRYSEVDRMGLLYHVQYYEYFEWARSDWMRRIYKPYKALEDEGVALVAIEANLHYHRPAYYDDCLEVYVELTEWGRSRVIFTYTIIREGEIDPLCTGRTAHCFINHHGKPTRIPQGLKRRLQEVYG